MKQIWRNLVGLFLVGGVVVTSLWVGYYQILKESDKMKESLIAHAQHMTQIVNDAIDAAYTEEVMLIEGKIELVKRRIFMQRPIQVIHSEKGIVSNHTVVTNFMMHGVVEEDFFQNSIDIDKNSRNVVIHYGYDDIAIITELLDSYEHRSTLYVAGEYIKGLANDSQRLGEMLLTGKYVEPPIAKDYWTEYLPVLKKYEWTKLSEAFEDSIRDELKEYIIDFQIDDTPLLTPHEKEIISEWEIIS